MSRVLLVIFVRLRPESLAKRKSEKSKRWTAVRFGLRATAGETVNGRTKGNKNSPIVRIFGVASIYLLRHPVTPLILFQVEVI